MTRGYPIGFQCFGCKKQIETPFEPPFYDDAEAYAGDRGWCIGHWDGQGEYVCEDCHPAVWDPIPLNLRVD